MNPMAPSLPSLVLAILVALLAGQPPCHAAEGPAFAYPTENRIPENPDGDLSSFFTPTPGRTWESGRFGCVRSEGLQFHEGLDIAAVRRDRRGEPEDPVLASAAGVVAYINSKAGLSNYGIYIVLRHRIQEVEWHTLYAHLSSVREDLRPGVSVSQGEPVGIMGRTSNTSSSISRERAHVHFEIGMLLSPDFEAWHETFRKGYTNDHGNYNGRNFAGLDPEPILRLSEAGQLDPLDHLRNQKEMFRIAVADSNLPHARRFYRLVRRNPAADRSGVAGYEISFSPSGVPFSMTPLAPEEWHDEWEDIQLISVNESVWKEHPCRGLLAKTGERFRLTARAQDLISILRY